MNNPTTTIQQSIAPALKGFAENYGPALVDNETNYRSSQP